MSIEFTCPECAERNTVGPEFAGRRGTCAFCSAQVIVPPASGVAQSAAPLPQAGATAGGPRSSSTPWVVILFAVCGVLVVCGGILAALLLPAVNAAREAGRRASCKNKLREIGLAMHNYNSTYGHLPPASGGTKDKPVSWRVAILPFLEHDYLYKQYRTNEPWNSPNNLALARQMPSEFRCPSDDEDAANETSYVMITGENTIGGTPGSSGVQLNLGQNANGNSQTIMVVEVHGLKIPWTEPRDISLDELAQRLQAGGGRIGHVASFNAAMADGSVLSLSAQMDPATLRLMTIINGDKPVNIDDF